MDGFPLNLPLVHLSIEMIVHTLCPFVFVVVRNFFVRETFRLRAERAEGETSKGRNIPITSY